MNEMLAYIYDNVYDDQEEGDVEDLAQPPVKDIQLLLCMVA
jgi:hypothetical protein